MSRLITYETLASFGYLNDALCQPPYKGLVIQFYGLGNTTMYKEPPAMAMDLAQAGILYLVPYTNPWAWMNPEAVALTDELVDVIFDHYHLPENLPIVSTGGSMGGHGALVYTRYAKRTPAACVANCPVCDLPYHFTERPDLPRTLYSAYFHLEGQWPQVLEAYSPLHLAQEMPDVPYILFHCEKDQAVNKARHSDRLVATLRPEHHVTYYEVPGMGHCQLPLEMQNQYLKHLKAICL